METSLPKLSIDLWVLEKQRLQTTLWGQGFIVALDVKGTLPGLFQSSPCLPWSLLHEPVVGTCTNDADERYLTSKA